MTSTQLLVKTILSNPHGLKWSLQGFGMLRLYLSSEVRLHIWHSGFMVPNVSLVHTHPWDFHSEVVVGQIKNTRYMNLRNCVATHCYAKIKCGEGGGIVETGKETTLSPYNTEIYDPGESYTQHAHEIHKTFAQDGAVTIVTRQFKEDTEHAYVYWEKGGEWVSAEPRPATKEEIDAFAWKALGLFTFL